MRVKREDVKDPTLPEEVVSVPELGGDVMVRGLGLAARMGLADLLDLHQDFKIASDVGGRYGHMTMLLAVSVLDADDQPLFSAKQWEAWGAVNNAAALKLWDIAWRLSDLDGKEAAKNSKAPVSE